MAKGKQDAKESSANRSVVDKVKESAEAGKNSLRTRVAQGEPGEKQPAHSSADSEDAVKRIQELQKDLGAEPRESSAERAKSGTGNNPVPPQDRMTGPVGDQIGSAANAAAGHLAAAVDAITMQNESDARLLSDPRYERDQKVYEMGQQGALGFVPKSEAELAAAGIAPEVAEKIPSTPEEQVADDMKRLEKAEEVNAQVKSGVVPAGVQDGDSKESTSKPLARGSDKDNTRGEASDVTKTNKVQ